MFYPLPSALQTAEKWVNSCARVDMIIFKRQHGGIGDTDHLNCLNIQET